MPMAQEVLQWLTKDNFFSKIDLSIGYGQLKVANNDINETAFVTPDGHFEFIKMPIGTFNSGATWKRGL